MVSELYIPLVFSLAIIYTATFGFCMYRTNKFNYFKDEWRHTKVFYISVIIQAFLRMTTYALLTFAVPESERTNPWIFVMESVPDTLFFVNYTLLIYQSLNIFYHSHMENNIHISLLIHFTRPKFRKVRRIIAFLLFTWLGVMTFIYILVINKVMNNFDIETEFSVVNLTSGTLVLVFLMYLYSKYSETPFKSPRDCHNLQKISWVLLVWTLGRYFKGFLGLTKTNSGSFLTFLSNSHSSSIFGALMVICENIVSEIICFIMVVDYRFINIFIFQDQANSGNSEDNTEKIESKSSNSESVYYDYGPIINSSDITIKKPFFAKTGGLGELFEASFNGIEVVYRKINFTRISGYVTEDVKAEIESLKSKNCSGLNFFYGAVMKPPEIGLVTAAHKSSLYKFLHEEKPILSLEDKLGLIKDIGFVIKSLHENEVYHGHLSSHNILITDKKKCVVSDLGLEKLKKYAGIMINYSNKSVWSSPESLNDSARVLVRPKPSDDVFSLGILIWEVMTQEVPHAELGPDTYKQEISSNKLTPKIYSYFPKDLVKLLNICWASVENRPAMALVYPKISGLKLKD